MLETNSNKIKIQGTNRRKRKVLNPVISYIIIAFFGTVLASIISYGLNKAGY